MKKKLTTEEFIEKAKKIHGDRYDYSQTVYQKAKINVKVICKTHGAFEQTPDNHLQGRGCIECSGLKKLTVEEFIRKANIKHSFKYTYANAEYKNSSTKLKITCRNHGDFHQIAKDHLNGFGCSKCSNLKKLTTEEFIERAKNIHKDTYDYSRAEYSGMWEKICISCKKHGDFMQAPANHINFVGCPKCKRSKGEKIIAWFLNRNNIYYEEQKKFADCRKKLPLPFDFFLPKLNLCIEFNGIQHYKMSNHIEKRYKFTDTVENDKIKKDYCVTRGIKLLVIKYNENIRTSLEKELDIKLI